MFNARILRVFQELKLCYVTSMCAVSDMLRDNDPLTNRFISVPRDYSPLNCASFMGGILRGALTSAGFVRLPACPTVCLWSLTVMCAPPLL